MKKIIAVIVLVVLAGGGAAYYFLKAQPAGGNDFASAVPADTLFYMGSNGEGNFEERMAALRRFNSESLRDRMDAYKRIAEHYGDAGRFIVGFYQVYLDHLARGEYIPGVRKYPRAAVYSVGLVPVVRFAVRDATKFRKFLDAAERADGAVSEKTTFDGVTVREYGIWTDKKVLRSKLLVAVRPGYVVMTLDTPAFRDQVLPLALGLKMPAKSLTQTGMLDRLAEENKLMRGPIAFLNHQAIVAALTGAPGSVAGQMLTTLDTKHVLASLRTSACQTDMQAIAKVWPMTVIGLDAQNPAAGPLHERMVSRLTDSSLTAQLIKLRGHIPAFLANGAAKPVFSLALGIDMSNLAPVAGALQQRFVHANFQCDWLVKAQQAIRQDNPAARTVAAALLRGVKGVSLSVFSMDFQPKPGGGIKPADVDALLAVAADNPEALVSLAKRMRPQFFGNINVPADGTAVPVPSFPNAKQPAKAKIAGHYLALFSGPQSAAASSLLANDDLAPNGALYYSLDYSKMMPLFGLPIAAGAAAANSLTDAQLEKFKQSMQRIAAMKLRINALFDFSGKGLVVDIKMAADNKPANRQGTD